MDGFDGRIKVDGCETIPKLFWHQVKARDQRTAFREKKLGIWRATSWREYGERARAVGMGLVKLGLKRGDVVSVLSDTVPEWLYADMGTMGAGGVTNGIYPTDSAKQVAFLPLCHLAERTFATFLPLRSGAIANLAESVETVPANAREVAPTTFFAVPRIWERFYSSIAIRMKEATWIGRIAYRGAIG